LRLITIGTVTLLITKSVNIRAPGNRLHSFYTIGSQKVCRWAGPHTYHEGEGLPPRNRDPSAPSNP